MITWFRFPARITTSAVMTFTMLPIGRSVSRPSLHRICPVAALASAPALIRIPVGPDPAAVPRETAAVFGAIVLAETGPATDARHRQARQDDQERPDCVRNRRPRHGDLL